MVNTKSAVVNTKSAVVNTKSAVVNTHSAAVSATRKFVPGEVAEPKCDLTKDEPKEATTSAGEAVVATTNAGGAVVATTQRGCKSWQDTPAAPLLPETTTDLAHPANAFQYAACHRYGVDRGTSIHCQRAFTPQKLCL